MRGTIIFLVSMLLAAPAAAQSAFLDGERARLRAHFDEVLAELEAADTSALSPQQRARRAEHLMRLAAYRDRGVFPRRYGGPPGRVPEFRDVHGTRCAMGELIYLSGETQLVDDVAATANSATIAELSADPRLTRWLTENGLSVEEAGRVQPSYSPLTPSGCLCSNAPTSIWTAYAQEEATDSTTFLAAYEVRVELLERISGTDTRTEGQTVVAAVHFPAALGTPLVVTFAYEGSLVHGYPADATFESMSCSTDAGAYLSMSYVCRADHPVAVDVAVEAMQRPLECRERLRMEDRALTTCEDESDGCAVGPRDASSESRGALISALLLAVLVVRRRRAAP